LKDRLTVPEKLPRLRTVTTEVFAPPTRIVRFAGAADMSKSGGETVTAKMVVWKRVPLVPLTEKM
jgi:hypothetical protein